MIQVSGIINFITLATLEVVMTSASARSAKQCSFYFLFASFASHNTRTIISTLFGGDAAK
jgi:hypothetical protein